VQNIDIVCPPARKTGRGLKKTAYSPIRAVAEHHGITCYDAPAKQKEPFSKWILPKDFDQKYDIGVVVSFGYFLPKELIRGFKCGAINLHPSILPKYRGAAPIQHALINGDVETGVSIIKVDETAFDVGGILSQSTFPIRIDDTFSSLAASLAVLGSEQVVSVLQDFPSAERNMKQQVVLPGDKILNAPKLKAQDTIIRWSELSSRQVYNLWRGIGEQMGVFTHLASKRIRLMRVELIDENNASDQALTQLNDSYSSGYIYYDKRSAREGCVYVKCKEGWIKCTSFKFNGRKEIDGTSFINGFLKQRQADIPRFE